VEQLPTEMHTRLMLLINNVCERCLESNGTTLVTTSFGYSPCSLFSCSATLHERQTKQMSRWRS